MTLSAGQFAQIEWALTNAHADAATLAQLRKLAPGVAITRCDATDMRDETPFRRFARCSLFLIDGRDHCWKITQDPACATGLLVAPNGGDA